MKITIVSLLCLACAVCATVLSDAAAGMTAGQWKQLTGMAGFENGNIMVPIDQGCSAGDYITQYAENAAWDPVQKRVLFYGATHGYCYAQRLIIYTDADNTWRVGPLHPGSCSGNSGCFSHGYDHSTVNPATGDFWYREYGGSVLYQYSVAGSWSTTAAVTENIVRAQGTCCNAIVYYPEMNGVVFSAGNGGTGAGASQVGFYNPATNAWSSLSTGIAVGDYDNMIQYNPITKNVFFGGGGSLTRNIYKLTATGTGTGTIVKLASPPIDIAVTSCVLSVDPVSGKFLVLSGNGFYEYDMAADSWKTLSSQVPSVLSSLSGYGDGLIEAPITTYGVIMFVKWNFTSSAVWLYKHTAGSAVEGARRAGSAPSVMTSPNPFKSTVRIKTTGPSAIYDVRGQKVFSTGEKEFTWNASALPAGIYLLKASAAGKRATARLLLRK